MSRLRYITPLLAAVAVVAVPAPALASPSQVIRDCAQDGKLDRHYSDSDLRRAEEQIPTDLDEYSNCHSVIDAARHHRGGGGGPSSSNPALVTPTGAVAGSHADLAALKSETSRAGKGSSPAVNIGGGTVSPATGGIARLAGVANRLPAPLLVALAAIAVLSVAGAMVVAFRRWPQLLRAPLRLLRR